MPILGKWHDGEQSQEFPAELIIGNDQLCQVINSDEVYAKAPLSELKISDRLGGLPRRLNFPCSGVFVTTDNQAIDNHLKKNCDNNKHSPPHWSSLLHTLESNVYLVIICLILVVGSVYAISKYGIPYAADKVSQHIPEELIISINESTLEHLDDGLLKATKLTEERQQELRSYFTKFEPEKRTVLFREGSKAIGANAFALPGSTIIFTDQMVELAQNDEELLSIYLHETGHINYRHSIRSVLQSSAVVLLITFVTGDGSGIAESLYSIPIILAHSAYSRKFETEADDHAYEMMQAHGIPLHRFADIMERLEKEHSASEDDSADNSKDQSKVTDYFSSHPATADRIQKFSQ